MFGVGSYNYQYVTRDTYGFAMKATAATINGAEYELYKDPVTDDGGKKSARGRLVVLGDGKRFPYELKDRLTVADRDRLAPYDALQTVWQNGKFVRRVSLQEIRQRVMS